MYRPTVLINNSRPILYVNQYKMHIINWFVAERPKLSKKKIELERNKKENINTYVNKKRSLKIGNKNLNFKGIKRININAFK